LKARWAPAVCAVALPLTACATDPRVAALDARLLAAPSATRVLADWCAEQGLANPPRIRADVDRGPAVAPTAAQRAALQIGTDEPVRYRRVSLRCGAVEMSRAENWYVPSRLPPEVDALLRAGDTPFGTAIAALGPSRRTLDSRRLHGGGNVLRHSALVLDRDGRPLAFVVETYRRTALGSR
jgi:hypothetical protein